MSIESSVDKLIELRKTVEDNAAYFSVLAEESVFQGADIYSLSEICNQIDLILKSIDKKLKATCSHEYVEDCIDIDSDRSQTITYCSICMCTF